MDLIQQQVPDYVGSILRGYQFGQQARANQLQMLAAQQEMDINKYKLAQVEAENILSKTASMGDTNALRQLAAYNPTRAEGIRKQQEYSDIQGARVLDSYASMPQYAFSQKKWEQMHNEYREATGRELPLPSEKSPEAILEFKRLSSRLKGREQDLKEQYQAAQIKTEGLQQGKIGIDIQKGKLDLQKGALDIMKSRGELLNAEQERQMASEQGLTLGAFKEQQQKIGQFRGEQISKLPQIEQNTQTTVKLVDDLLKHEGFKDVVGATYKPFARKVAGTDAAGFMAKYNQLKGKQFLESISQLQGYGALSNLEGTTATNAASAMDISTSEAEFIRNAREYQRILQLGFERIKRGIGYNGQRIQMQNAGNASENESNVIEWGSL
ncbi:MAG: hypothetical protein ACO21H_01270 [Sediminibacterium sp.]|jgi:hypothetical protein|nr:hypothetical protein [Pseudomonadota bacterium]